MDIKDLEHEIKLLKQKIEWFDEVRKGQASRIESDKFSEKRHRENLEKRFNSHESSLETRLALMNGIITDNKKDIDDHQKALYNSGTGQMFRVQKLETKLEHSDSMLQKVALVISVIISALALYFSVK